jgi:hypothetical protein
VKFDRGAFESLLEAEQTLCGRRLNGKVQVCPKDEASGQGQLFDGTRPEVAGVFDVKRFSVCPKNITAGLTFSLADVDVASLPAFAKHAGRLIIEMVSELVDEENEDDDSSQGEEWTPDDEDAEAIADENAAASGDARVTDWRKRPIAELGLNAAKNTILREAGIKTLGALSRYIDHKTIDGGGLTWHRDLKGIGEAAATEIADKFAGFFEKHPECCAEGQPQEAAAGE